MKLVKKITVIILAIVLATILVFFAGRYGWKCFGFSACHTAVVESVDVSEDFVSVKGNAPGLIPNGFCGYYAKQDGDVLYIGFRFSSFFGVFETGAFDVTVPTTSQVNKVIMKAGNNEYTLFAREDSPSPAENEE